MRWLNSFILFFSASSTVSKYTERPSGCDCIPNIDCPNVYKAIVNTMRRKEVTSAWIPIKPVLYEQWRWTNQELYGRYMYNYSTINRLNMCTIKSAKCKDFKNHNL